MRVFPTSLVVLVLARAAMAADPATAVYNHACAWCHGKDGRGDGPSAPALRDADGLPIRPADLRYPARFKGGAEPVDLYRTLMSGLEGTPMPSYASAFDDPRAPWDLVAYLRSLHRR